MRLRHLLFAAVLALQLGTVLAQYTPRSGAPPVPPATPPQPISTPAPTTTSANPTAVSTTSNSSPDSPTVRTSAMPDSMDKIDNKRALLIGDIINYRVTEDRDPAVSLPINDSGEIEVPLIGRVPAAGKTLRKLADDIKALLEKDYYYHATVLLSMDVMYRARDKVYKVYVSGQVRTPGPQDIPNDEVYTVGKAILRASGFAEFADKRKVKLVRKKSPDSKESITIIVDCTAIFDKGDTSNDPVVQPDDYIIVPQRLINF